MKVLKSIKKEDGGCTLDLDLTPEEMNILIEVGFNKLLKDGMEEFEKTLSSDKIELSSVQRRNVKVIIEGLYTNDTAGRCVGYGESTRDTDPCKSVCGILFPEISDNNTCPCALDLDPKEIQRRFRSIL